MAVPRHAAGLNTGHGRGAAQLAPQTGRATLAAMASSNQRDFTLDPADSERLANLAGPFDGHLRQIELRMGVEISNRGNVFRVTGRDAEAVAQAEKLLRALYEEAATETLDIHAINVRLSRANLERNPEDYAPQEVAVKVKRGTVRGRGVEVVHQ